MSNFITEISDQIEKQTENRKKYYVENRCYEQWWMANDYEYVLSITSWSDILYLKNEVLKYFDNKLIFHPGYTNPFFLTF